MKVAYLSHPIAGDIAGNVSRARRWLLWANEEHPGWVIIAPWLAEIDAGASDLDPVAREMGLARCEAVIAKCDALWIVGGRISDGMRREIHAAAIAGVRVVDLIKLGPEPPAYQVA